MIIQSLRLTNFRNYKSFETTFDPNINLITGQNGSGKTNILEAIYLISTGRSFRARYDHEMIYNPKVISAQTSPLDDFNGNLPTKEFAKIVAEVKYQDNADADLLDITLIRENPASNVSQKLYKLNGTPKRQYDFVGKFNCVLFTPYDLELFTGSPSLRRLYLNEILYKTDKNYQKEYNTYTKVLKSRNKILEKINKTSLGGEELTFWNEKLLSCGLYIQTKRRDLVNKINKLVQIKYSELSKESSECQIIYIEKTITKERLAEYFQREVMAKSTLIGPHRDDFIFALNRHDISRYGSRGQQRSAILSLKMSEIDLLTQTTGTHPVLLLDDIFSELDQKHKDALGEVIKNQQTIITSTQQEIKPSKLIKL